MDNQIFKNFPPTKLNFLKILKIHELFLYDLRNFFSFFFLTMYSREHVQVEDGKEKKPSLLINHKYMLI